MASNPLKFAIDRQNQALLTGLAFFLGDFPVFFQGDIRDLVMQVFDPGGVAAATPVDMTGYSMRVTLGIPGGEDPSTIYAGPLVMAWNPAPGNSAVTGNNAGYFSGSLDLTQAALTDAIDTQTEIEATLDIDVRLNGVTQTLLQVTVTIAAVVDQGTQNNSPVPANAYGTIAENNQMYLRKAGTTADSKIWVSQNGQYAALQYLDNNGKMQFEPINPPPAAVP
jgi:hypothetical protein